MRTLILLAGLALAACEMPVELTPEDRAADACRSTGTRGSPQWTACYTSVLPAYLASEDAAHARRAAWRPPPPPNIYSPVTPAPQRLRTHCVPDYMGGFRCY
jgi:hypothetical protein